MDEERLAEIEARANAATPGPWEAGESAFDSSTGGGSCLGVFAPTKYSPRALLANEVFDEADAAFIAHARADVPDLVAEMRRLRDTLERLVHRAEHTAQTMQDHSHLWAAAKRARRVLEGE